MTKPDSRTRSRTREAIIKAAAQAFRELGFDHTSMDEIARRAEVARGTLYYNFDSKDEIAIRVAEAFRADGYARFLEQQEAGVATLRLLDNFFIFAGKAIAENKDAFFIGTVAAIKGVGREPDRPGTTRVFEGLVEQGQTEGVFRQDIPATTIARLLAALLTQAALQGPHEPGEERTDWPLHLLHVALQGVVAPGKGLK